MALRFLGKDFELFFQNNLSFFSTTGIIKTNLHNNTRHLIVELTRIIDFKIYIAKFKINV